ncbi:glycoside hydrolase family 92 protein [Marinilabiliaceae bacterium JC017]|nr:glycoside hydrolase family 92 protein [Marinilabiliaceae bacterium JC017]
MNKQVILFLSVAWLFMLSGCQEGKKGVGADDPLQYVDPFIGTGFHGHTFPGATVPYGMVQLSPDTHLEGWDACSGYHYEDSVIYGFSHTHLSGTGIGDLGDVLFLPYSRTKEKKPVATFKKEEEAASPGYYKVKLDNFGVTAELTATKRVGLHRYGFEDKEDRNLMLDLSHILQANWGHRMVENRFKMVDAQTIEGVQRTSGWAQDHLVAYRAEFSEPFKDWKVIMNGKESKQKEFTAEEAIVHFQFDASDKPLIIKVAISPVDTRGAALNMKEELPGWDFNRTMKLAKAEWRDALKGIKIKTKDKVVKTNFYTGLYHCMMAPVTWQDVDGRYRGMNKEIMQAPEGFTNYTVFSLWDTFRALHPLMTILNPDKATEWSEALVQKYSEGGVLPKWPLASNYTGTMVGYPAVSVMADVVAKGLYTGDLDDWLEAAVTSATYQPGIVEKFKGTREAAVMPKHIFYKETLGWVPCDKLPESVSYGLEMAYYDWCVAKIAEAAGDKKTAAAFMKKSEYYKTYFDKESGLMRGKNEDGSWRTPFRPRYSSHEESDYVEGNAWQWSFFVPHAPEGMIGLYDNPEQFEAMLDTLFTTDSSIEGEKASGDITGLVGQYAHGNEPSHHMAYLYNYTASPYKAQERLDQIMREFYLPEPGGIIGNEDCGQMSAWYVMSAMGFYQVCPGDPTYTTGRPLVDKAVITVPGGKFEIVAHNNSPENKYVKELRLNGKKLDKPFFTHDDIMKGGKLEFFMSDAR